MKDIPKATRRRHCHRGSSLSRPPRRAFVEKGRWRRGAAAFALATLPHLAFLAPTSAQGTAPSITEFMAANGGSLSLADNSTPDWIELFNPGATAFDLAGWHLTDSIESPARWTFPPGASIAAGAYLVVYASGLDSVGPGGEYHLNFGLNGSGEYLALVRPDGTVQQEFAPAFPRQYTDVSYGLAPGQQTYGYFQAPTPGAANNSSVLGFVQDTTFSHKRGFYDQPFALEVTTATPGATLVYSTDGSTPGPGSPRVEASDPATPPVLSLTVTTTTIVRVYAEKAGFQRTNIDTQTYLFLDQVIAHPNMSTTITQNAVWGPQMRDALLEIPSISLVTQEDIPTEPVMSPPEIPVSIEMIFPDGRDGFHADAGVERFGGQFTVYPKKALRVSFKSIYGPSKLQFDLFGDTPYGGDTAVDSFDQILLRNGSHDCLFDNHYAHSLGVYVRNRYFFDRQIEMGHLSMRGKFVHVYLNGEYYGQFHLMERPNADFMATHQGGNEEDYDIMKGRSGIFVSQGESTAWDYLVANKGNYAIVQDYMDVDNYIDYMLLNFYGGNEHDWYPQHNWVAGRKREPGGKFQFFMWDNDFLIRRGGNATTGSTANTVDNGGPGNMLNALKQHAEFRIRMADLAQKHFFNGGMLTKERVKADITELAQRISRTIIPETARWSATAVAYNASQGISIPFYTPSAFQNYVNWIVNVNAATRTDVVIGQMRADGLFPSIDAPVFSQHGGEVAPGYQLQIDGKLRNVYYTTDGSDPRLPGGTISPTAILIPGELIDFTSIPAGSVWKYSDDGTDLGTAWRAKDYNDSAWPSGAAPLGFGGINGYPNLTQVNPGRYLTVYGRKSFDVAGTALITGTTLQIHADGGAVVYLNGTEAVRDNMPAGAIGFSTPSVNDGNEGVFDSYTFDHALLVEGSNTIAVEVHNSTAASSDMVIDLALVGKRLSEGTDPIPINTTTTIRARALQGTEWSALNEATFIADTRASPGNLVLSKIHYHPSVAQGDLAEYIELMNISEQTVSLAGVAFTQGITFAFGDGATLGPGQRAVLVGDPSAFVAAFGSGATVMGTFTGRLADGGERVTLSAADGSPIRTLRYGDRAPWPSEADGSGYSLVLISPESGPDHALPQNWRASAGSGGSPGASDSIPFTGATENDLLVYALGDPETVGARVVNGVPVFEFPRVLGADDATVTVELSSDLMTWRAGEAFLLDQSERVGNASVLRWSLAIDGGGRKYARLILSRNE